MKRLLIIGIIMGMAAAAAGCESAEVSDNGIDIYYINASGYGLDTIDSELEVQYSDALVSSVISMLSNPDIDADEGSSVLQNGIEISSYKYTEDERQISVDLAGDYGSLANTDKFMLTAGIALTFEQIEGISSVYITIQGEPLLDSNGEDIGSFKASDFVIHSGNEINVYTSTTLQLYFLDSTGKELVCESRVVYYNSNVLLEQVVLEELVKGPQSAGYSAALAANLDFVSVTVQDDVCYINFDDDVIQAMVMYDTESALQSIVRSINDTCGIAKVQFMVNGDTFAQFADGITIDRIYEAN